MAAAVDEAPPRRRPPYPVELYRTAVGKKYVMAVTGIIWMGYVLAHMAGNLKIYMGADDLNHYAEGLRGLGAPFFPHSMLLWLGRLGLIAALALHIHAAYSLTRMNWAKDRKYESRRDYVAANFASRTMRWTGTIVLLFIIWHLADLTWGVEAVNPDYVRGDVYNNVVSSFERTPVAILYIVANLALGVHLLHGAWSLFQSLGWNHPRFNAWRRWFAYGFTIVVIGGNVSFPLAVMTGVIE
ncbi:MAG TPA: succinate dehydrogenase cytochrome b subunit [Acidimicrobiales bacterium]|nr:succinate dehydrogenase cytochrome b subunit [Acidimicrobiales bacterium]